MPAETKAGYIVGELALQERVGIWPAHRKARKVR